MINNRDGYTVELSLANFVDEADFLAYTGVWSWSVVVENLAGTSGSIGTNRSQARS